MERATQKTQDQAAALIQARVRGRQQRLRDHRVLRAVTKLQARQRARFTRREFQKLLAFYNEQESFLQESKRRQLRLWHREQELYFLQHTTAEELDAIRSFQYQRSALRIQRAWRESHPPVLEDVDISGLGRPFDPFGLVGQAVPAPRSPPPRSTILQELYGQLPRRDTPVVDDQQLARRRAEVHDNLQKRCKENNSQKPPPTRRELYDELVALRQRTAERLTEVRERFRSQRPQRDREAAQLNASVQNRVAFLRDEKRVSMLATRLSPERLAAEKKELETSASKWRSDRQAAAWHDHTRVLQSVWGKTKWFKTSIAGTHCDIRRVYAESPWEHDKQVWQWPPPPSPPVPPKPNVPRELLALDRFQFCLDAEENNQDKTLVPEPLDDQLASMWWRAHATQSHTSVLKLQARRLPRLRSRNYTHFHEDAAVTTPEMLVNQRFYDLYQRVCLDAKRRDVEAAADARVATLERSIRNQIVDVETRIEVNTRLIMEERARVLQQKARKTKEEQSAIQIQRVARGRIGRHKAREHLAEYFVLVRGRAIRKGKCEECGEHAAVLACESCEESRHFCPSCWVHVHATRRRKAHVPIPMAVVPTPEKEVKEERPKKTPMKSTAALVSTALRQVEPVVVHAETERVAAGVTTKSQRTPPPTRSEAVVDKKEPGVGREVHRAIAVEVKTGVAPQSRPNTTVVEPDGIKTDRTEPAPAATATDEQRPATENDQIEAPSIVTTTDERPRPKSTATSATVAKPKPSDSEKKPRMSLRDRMAAEKAPQATVAAQKDTAPALEALQVTTPIDVQPNAVQRTPLNDAASAPAILQNPSEKVETTTPVPRNTRDHQAARKIQSFLRKRVARKQGSPSNTDK